MRLRRFAGGLAVAGTLGVSALLASAPVAAQTGPVSENDVATVEEDESVTIDVLANDEPSTGLSLASVTDPPNGTAVIEDDEVVYTPDDDFSGTDTFAYTVTDGDTTVGAAVTVTVEDDSDDDSGSPSALDPRVVEACEEHEADAKLQGLCGAYQNEDIPSWARARIGHVILKLVAYRVPDAVLEACERTESEYADWLCDIYESGHLPPGLQKQLGRQIVALADTDISFDRGGDTGENDPDGDDERRSRDKDWKPWVPRNVDAHAHAHAHDHDHDGDEDDRSRRGADHDDEGAWNGDADEDDRDDDDRDGDHKDRDDDHDHRDRDDDHRNGEGRGRGWGDRD